LTSIALDGAEKKFGGKFGANTDKNRNVNEKVVCNLFSIDM
jgi:hypothetical protein